MIDWTIQSETTFWLESECFHTENRDKLCLNYRRPNHNYSLYSSFETSDGIAQKQKGELKDAGSDHAAVHYVGEYSYKDPSTGKTIHVTYTATDAGYHSQTNIQ